MYIMNLIHDICLTKNKINNIPKWKIITRSKEVKRLNNDMIEFLNLDIFSASDNIITFLLSLNLNNEIRDTIPNYNESFIHVDIGKDTIIHVDYYPRSNRFEVWDKDVAYTIYRNTKICNHINKMWEPLTMKIKEEYLKIIIQIAEYVLTPKELKDYG